MAQAPVPGPGDSATRLRRKCGLRFPAQAENNAPAPGPSPWPRPLSQAQAIPRRGCAGSAASVSRPKPKIMRRPPAQALGPGPCPRPLAQAEDNFLSFRVSAQAPSPSRSERRMCGLCSVFQSRPSARTHWSSKKLRFYKKACCCESWQTGAPLNSAEGCANLHRILNLQSMHSPFQPQNLPP